MEPLGAEPSASSEPKLERRGRFCAGCCVAGGLGWLSAGSSFSRCLAASEAEMAGVERVGVHSVNAQRAAHWLPQRL